MTCSVHYLVCKSNMHCALCSVQFKPQLLLLVQVPHVTQVYEVPEKPANTNTNTDMYKFLLYLASFMFLQLAYLFIQLNVWKTIETIRVVSGAVIA